MLIDKISEAHTSLVNGQGKQFADQVDEIGNYDFWELYAKYLTDVYVNISSAYDYLSKSVILYNRIKSR